MDNIRAHLVAVLVNIVHIELLGKQRIPLYRNHRIFLAVHILCIDINFRPVKCRLADILHKRDGKFHKHITDMLFGLLPDLRFANIFPAVIRIPFREMVRHIILQSKRGQTVFCQRKTVFKLLHHLIRAHH